MSASLLADFQLIGPLVILVAFVLFSQLVLLVPEGRRLVRESGLQTVGLIGLGAALLANLMHVGLSPRPAFSRLIVVDAFTGLAQLMVLVAGIMAMLCFRRCRQGERTWNDSLIPLLLMSLVGLLLMVCANDLILLFLGCELVTIGFTLAAALGGRRRTEDQGLEFAFRILTVGGLFSALMLYGVVLMYGQMGASRLSEIGSWVVSHMGDHGSEDHVMFQSGLTLICLALASKLVLAPILIWRSDVTYRLPLAVTMVWLLALVPAMFVALARVLIVGAAALEGPWEVVTTVFAGLAIIVGAALVPVQRSLERLVWCGAIAHIGFLMLGIRGIAGGGLEGPTALLGGLMAYVLMVGGAMAGVRAFVGKPGDRCSLEALEGVGRRHPGFACALAICFLSMAGMPFTFGGASRFALLSVRGTEDGWVMLGLLGVSSLLVAIGFLRPLVVMFRPGAAPGQPCAPGRGGWFVLLFASILTLWSGLAPDVVKDLSSELITAMWTS